MLAGWFACAHHKRRRYESGKAVPAGWIACAHHKCRRYEREKSGWMVRVRSPQAPAVQRVGRGYETSMSAGMRTRGYLPHLEGERAIYFVTFRLADSLPRQLLARLSREREILEHAMRAGTHIRADSVRQEKLRALLRKAEQFLDAGRGACYLRDPRISGMVANALRHFEGQRYRLFAWCVMPNHVHVVFSPLGDNTLHRVVHSWKSYSALAANRLLRRSGSFWQREYFDHSVRNEASLLRIVRYVRQNPEKAGLRDWPWVGGDFVPPASSRQNSLAPFTPA